MSTGGMLAEPHEDDVIVIFRRGAKGERRKAERIAWKDVRAAIVSSIPDSSAIIEDLRLADARASKASAEALSAEVKAREAGDKLLSSRHLHAEGMLVLPGGLAVAVGKTIRSVPISIVKFGDNLNVTFRAPLPAGLTLGECYCTKDGELSIVLLAVSAVTVNPRADLPFTVAVLRPPA